MNDAKIVCMIGELSRGACEMLLDSDLPDDQFPDVGECRANILQQYTEGTIAAESIIAEWSVDP